VPRPSAPAPDAPAPPPATARVETPREPAAAARPQVPDDEAQIRATLAAYAQGYRSLDANAILRVYPKAPAQALRNAFQEARGYDVEIDVSQIKVTGDRAVVSSRVRQTFRPKAGRAQENTQATEFEMQKSGNSWVIVARR
jgi:ketosteroid isomerase-like protein